MPSVPDKKGVAEADPNNPEGEGSPGAADPVEIEGLKAALKAEREKRQGLATQLARVEGTVEGLKSGQQPKPDAPARVYTRAELRAMVTAGQITEDQMDSQLEMQLEAKLAARVDSTTSAAAVQAQAAATVETQMAAYIDAHPDLLDTESDLRAKVQEEFDYLVGVCKDDPKDKRTELKAIRSAVGALAPKGRKKEPEPSEETGGSDGAPAKGGADDGWAKGLTAAQKAHYQKKINQNIYKGTSDKNLLAEVAIARRQREQKAVH
jgi:hypothetical protein